MNAFYAFDFIFDDVPSQKFDLKIITFEDSGLFSGVGSSDVEILTQQVLRKAKPYYLGRIQKPVLEFPLTFGTAAPISAIDRDLISSWLFGRAEYKKLYIMQDDLNGAYFNCFLTQPIPQYIGGVNYAFNCQVVCDSPFAYSQERIISGSLSNGNTGDISGTWKYIDIYNSSSEDEYLYPDVHFVITTDGNPSVPAFVLKNITDSNREFSFSTLIAETDVTVNNDLQIITTNATNLLSQFNKNWFRLLPKYNSIAIQGNVDLYEIRYRERLKIGG